jgi:hypothetical protein
MSEKKIDPEPLAIVADPKANEAAAYYRGIRDGGLLKRKNISPELDSQLRKILNHPDPKVEAAYLEGLVDGTSMASQKKLTPEEIEELRKKQAEIRQKSRLADGA